MANIRPRITARVDVQTQELLIRASALAGMSNVNSFVLNAAVEKAKKIVEQEQMLQLSEQDALLLAKALDTPARPNSRLQQAAQRYQESKDS
ncbi:type II toxin-antitoxin system TacA family antitoxin [Dongshaea marina]|uniref:type II toxin-antitoxin system TacA family antitoxin n=1 Tax=Dongshaea marina TaxID=2047966 RepID=UPI000D3E7DCE|nr:DUF1778 domain-containing protein [Dongshaea marina]